jgi:hypothetical protein
MLTELLDMPAGQVLLDHSAVDRLITAAAGATGKPWVGLFEAYMKAASDPELTASDALRSAGVKQLGAVRDGLTMLEKADAEIELHHEAATKQLDAGNGGGGDSAKIDDAAAAQALADPIVREQRWLRAQRAGLAPTREQWELTDRPALEVGLDKLAEAEHATALARVRNSDDRLVAHLNAAITEGHRTGDLKVLDRAIAQARRPDARGDVISLAAGVPSNVLELVREPVPDPKLVELDARIRERMRLANARPGEYQKYFELERQHGPVATLDAPPTEGPQFERRLARARAVKSGTYDGDAGRQRFAEHDRKANENDSDLVADLERTQRQWVAAGIIAPGGKV